MRWVSLLLMTAVGLPLWSSPLSSAIIEEIDGKKWRQIDEFKLKAGKKKKKIIVGYQRGRVHTILFKPEVTDVHITEVEIHYARGAKEIRKIDEIVKAGKYSKPIELSREKSYLKKLYVSYRIRVGQAPREDETKTQREAEEAAERGEKKEEDRKLDEFGEGWDRPDETDEDSDDEEQRPTQSDHAMVYLYGTNED